MKIDNHYFIYSKINKMQKKVYLVFYDLPIILADKNCKHSQGCKQRCKD